MDNLTMASGKMVYGVGINDGKYPASIAGKNLKEYRIWAAMLQRCYSEKFQGQGNLTYMGCSVSEKFKSYSYFYEWCQKQIGFGLKDWELDKDLLVKGNVIYSEENCVFIPRQINTALTKSNKSRGKYMIGVSFHNHAKKYTSTIIKYGKPLMLGYFNSELDAYIRYKSEKESYIKQLAETYKGLIDERSYVALLGYEVSEND